MGPRAGVVCFLVFVGIAFGCGSSGTNGGPGVGGASGSGTLFKPCTQDGDCGTGFCLALGAKDTRLFYIPIERYCSQACATDADCPSPSGTLATSCGTGPDGSKVCMEGVCPNAGLDVACQDGVITACQAANETFCDRCGCPNARSRCEPNVGCMPPSDVGGPCVTDSDCASYNCDTGNQRCFVALGSPCTVDNCPRCVGIGSDTICTKGCAGNSECGGGICLTGFANSTVFPTTTCGPPCGSGVCPGGCHYIDDGDGRSIEVCDCTNCLSPPGGDCYSSGDCTSSACTNGKCQ